MRTTTRTRSLTGAVAAAVLALGLTACGGGDEVEPTDGDPGTSSDTPADQESGSDPASTEDSDSTSGGETGSDSDELTVPEGGDAPSEDAPSDDAGSDDADSGDGPADDADTGDLLTELPEEAMVSVVYMYSEGGANRADVITASSGELMFQSGDPAQTEPEVEETTELSDADWESMRSEIVELGIPTASGQPDPSRTDPADPSNFEGTYFWMIGGQDPEPLAFAGDDANLDQALWEIVESYR